MAPRTAVLMILLVAVSLVFAVAGHVNGQQQPGACDKGQGPELVAGGMLPESKSHEERLYKGPCLELVCTAACLVRIRQGGHCKGNFFSGGCYCFEYS